MRKTKRQYERGEEEEEILGKMMSNRGNKISILTQLSFFIPGSSYRSNRSWLLVTHFPWRRLRHVTIGTPSVCRGIVTSHCHAASVASPTARFSTSVFSSSVSSCSKSSSTSNTTTFGIPHGSLRRPVRVTPLQSAGIEDQQRW